jgi:tripartite-type tricarboxylate transporter receptor subunit TctC
MKFVFRIAKLFLVMGILLFITGPAVAQNYPNKSIILIVPYAPGGAASTLARIVSQKLGENLGQSIVLDNRPGANGNIANEFAAKSAPDGYTLLLGTISTMTINSGLYKKLSYDPIKDFAPLSTLVRQQNILVVNPSVPAKSLKELIALAKSKPGQLTFCSSGNGSTFHLSGELFKSMAGIDMTHIPYKGGGPAQTDLIAGRITMMFNGIGESIGFVKAGRLRAVAVTGSQRSPFAPEIPTMAESGLPGFEVTAWYGMYAPAGTPKEIIVKLNREIVKTMQSQEMKEKLLAVGAEAISSTPEELSVIMKADLVKWAKIVKESGATLD